MAAAGLKYFAAGSNNFRAPVLLQGRLHEKSPFWWEGPDGGRVLMWYTRQYQQIACVFGMPPQIPAGRDSLPIFLQAYSRPDYKSDAVMLYGAQIENADLFPQVASLAEKWNDLYAFPHLKYSGIAEAMSYITGQFGDALPVVRGDGGPLWEDGVASTARAAAIERETEQRALAAEKFSTISSLVNPRRRPEAEALKRLWDNVLMFNEHSWGAGGSVSDPKSQETVEQLALKEGFPLAAKRDADYVIERSLASLADYIYDPKGTLLVFNPLSWAAVRSGRGGLGQGPRNGGPGHQPHRFLRSALHGEELPACPFPRAGRAVGGLQGLRAEGDESRAGDFHQRLRRRRWRISTTGWCSIPRAEQ